MQGGVTYDGNTLLSGSINVNTGGNIQPLTLEYNENGEYTVNAPSGVDGYDPININVNIPQVEPVLDTLIVSQNGQYRPPSGVAGYNLVDVNVITPPPVLDTLSVTTNGTYTPPEGVAGYNQVNVNVPSVTLNQIANSLELTNEVNVNYNTANQLQSGHDYLIIANTDFGVRCSIFTFNGSTNVVDLLDLGGRFTINMSASSCYWDWNSGGVSWCSINVFELVSPLLPSHT